jgi:hypothetical protein
MDAMERMILGNILEGTMLLGGGAWKPEGTAKERLESLRKKMAEDQKNPYKVGDVITPIKGKGNKGHGKPHIVVEAYPELKFMEPKDDCSVVDRYDVIVAVEIGDRVNYYAQESSLFEPYDETK